MLELRESDPLSEMRLNAEQQYRHQDKGEYKDAFPSMSNGPVISQKKNTDLEQAIANSLKDNPPGKKKGKKK